jgi:hypothetical protein
VARRRKLRVANFLSEEEIVATALVIGGSVGLLAGLWWKYGQNQAAAQSAPQSQGS